MKAYVATMQPQHNTRDYFRNLTLEAYRLCGIEAELIVNESNFARYYMPEKMDDAPYYIVSDDDVIPCKPEMFVLAERIMDAHPQIGALGFPARPRLQREDVIGYIRGDIESNLATLWDFDHFGGMRVVRRGFAEEPFERPDYTNGRGGDRIYCDMVRAKGMTCAYTPDLFFHHLGETFTTIWLNQ